MARDRPADLAAVTLADPADPVPVVAARLVLEGDFRRVVIRYCTIDPGGEQARRDPVTVLVDKSPAVTLEVRGKVERLAH